MPTIGDILGARQGEGKGFGLLRLGLAAAIFFYHSTVYSGTVSWNDGWSGPTRPILYVLVPAFFALSGFLVTGSALRLRKTSTFIAFRVLRILPALSVEVMLSAVVLGAVFTHLPLSEYFTEHGFWRYFGNIIGLVTFTLPGVFTDNPVNTVNGNLWTLPAELHCYLITAALMITGAFYNRRLMIMTLGLVTAIFLVMNTFGDFAANRNHASPTVVTFYFFVGLLFFHWKNRIPMNWHMFALSAATAYLLTLSPHTVFLAPVFVTYCVVFLGVAGLPEMQWIKKHDYSYGLYLYGCPILQAIMATAPLLKGHAALVSGVGFCMSIGLAALSWIFIEKPTLALKNRLPELAERSLGARPQILPQA